MYRVCLKRKGIEVGATVNAAEYALLCKAQSRGLVAILSAWPIV